MTRLEPREYSKRVGVLTHEQLQAALDRFDLGELRGAEPAPSGLFGQNVMLSASTGEYVLRGAPWPAWQLPMERHVAEMIHDAHDSSCAVAVPRSKRAPTSSDGRSRSCRGSPGESIGDSRLLAPG